MTGLFQLFDRYKALAGRKNGSKKGIKTIEAPSKDSSHIPGYYVFQDEPVQRRGSLDNAEQRKGYMAVLRDKRRASIDNSDVLLAKSVASQEVQPLVDQRPKQGHISLDTRPSSPVSLPSKDGIQASPDSHSKAAKEGHHKSISGPVQKDLSKPAPVPARASVDGRISIKEPAKPPSRSIRGILKASFYREKLRVPVGSRKDAKITSLNLEKCSLGQSKDSTETSANGKKGVQLSHDLPHLNSTEKDQSLADGRELPKSSVERNVYDGKEYAGLAVPLSESCRISPSKDDLQVYAIGNDFSRVSSSKDGGLYVESSPVPDFREAVRAMDSRDSPRSFEMKRDGSEHSAHGRNPLHTSVPSSHSFDSIVEPHPSSTPPLSINGRDSLQASSLHALKDSSDESINGPLPLLTRDESIDSIGESETRWRAPNVVARLMGLQELPSADFVPPLPTERISSREGTSLHKLLNSAPPEASSPASDHYQLQHQWGEVLQGSKQVSVGIEKDLQSELRSNSSPTSGQTGVLHSRPSEYPATWQKKVYNGPHQKRPTSPKHHLMEGMPPAMKNPDKRHPSGEGLLYGNVDKRLQQLHIQNSIHERKTLKQILEAMHLKGLLHPPQHKQLDDTNRNVSRTELAVGILLPLLQETKELPSSAVAPSVMQGQMGLDYLDSVKLRTSQELTKRESKMQNEHHPQVKLSKTNLLKSQLQIINPGSMNTGEVSIVVMKPVNLKLATKLPASDHVPSLRTKELESIPSRLSSSSMGPADREKLNGSSNWASSKSTTRRPGNSRRSLSQDSLDQYSLGPAATVRLSRQERIAAQKAASEAGEVRPLEFIRRTARSVSPPLPKQQWSMARDISLSKSGSSGRSTFGSGSGRMDEGSWAREKPARSTLKDREETKATRVTVQSQSSGGLPKERASNEQATSRVLGRSRSDRRLHVTYSERHVLVQPSSSRSRGGRITAEVAVLPTKRASSRAKRSLEKSRTLPTVDVQTGVSATRIMSSESSEVSPHRADSYGQLDRTQSKDLATESGAPVDMYAPVVAPMIALAPPVTLWDSPRSMDDSALAGKASQLVEQKREPLIVMMLESSVQVSEHEVVNCSNDSSHKALTRDDLSTSLPIPSTGGIQGADVAAAEVDGTELSTPRGVSVTRPEFCNESESQTIAEGDEHPSPVSVLDNTPFLADEFTPTQEVEKSIAMSCEGLHLTDTERACTLGGLEIQATTPDASEGLQENDDPLWSKVARVLNLDHQESHLHNPTLEVQVPFISGVDTDTDALGISLQISDEELASVPEIVVTSGFTQQASVCNKEWTQSENAINPEFLTDLVKRFQLQESSMTANRQQIKSAETERSYDLHKRALLDSVSDILGKKLYEYDNPQPWSLPILRERPVGQQLVQEVWDELQEFCYPQSDDYNALYSILKKDLARKGQEWLNCGGEIGKVGCEVGEMLFEEMVESCVVDLMAVGKEISSSSPQLKDDQATRRDLLEQTRRELLAWHVQYKQL